MISYAPLTSENLVDLKAIVGEQFVLTEIMDIFPYAMDGTLFTANSIPEVVVQPHSKEEISKILKLANKYHIPVTPRGSGTSLAGGPLAIYGGIILDMRFFNKIASIDIPNNIVLVEPGVICDELNFQLGKCNYFFPPDPGSSSAATIGGMIANNAGGIQAFKYGVTANYVLWLEVVLPTGDIVEFGAQVLKSTSSYNFTGLMVGSEGTLGVITKAALKIRPLPAARKTGFYIFNSFSSVIHVITKLRETGIIPNMMEFLDKTTSKVCFDYLGGEYAKYPNGYFLLLETDGTPAQVQEEFTKMDIIAQTEAPLISKLAQAASDRTDIISARKAALPALSRLAPTTSIEDCTINLSNLIEAVRRIEEIPALLAPTNIKLATFGHLEGNLHPTFLFNENIPKDIEDFEKAMKMLYEDIVLPLSGTVTGEHGVGLAKSPYMAEEHTTATDLMHKLKHFFDPNLILNPGKGKGMEEINYKNPRTVPERLNENFPSISCMRCGFCLTACPGLKCFQKESFSPRGKLALIRGVLRGNVPITDRFRYILYACTLCGACASKCPAGILTNELFESIRQEIMSDKEVQSNLKL